MKIRDTLVCVLVFALLLCAIAAPAQSTRPRPGTKKSAKQHPAPAPAAKPDSSPSLAETIDWMKQTLEQYGHTAQAKTGCTSTQSRASALRAPLADQCVIEITRIVADPTGCTGPQGTATFIDRVNLRDLDAARIETEVYKRNADKQFDEFAVNAPTSDAAGGFAVRESLTVNGHSNVSMIRWLEIYVSSQDISARFAKALKHAVDLCSQKKSLF